MQRGADSDRFNSLRLVFIGYSGRGDRLPLGRLPWGATDDSPLRLVQNAVRRAVEASPAAEVRALDARARAALVLSRCADLRLAALRVLARARPDTQV